MDQNLRLIAEMLSALSKYLGLAPDFLVRCIVLILVVIPFLYMVYNSLRLGLRAVIQKGINSQYPVLFV